MVKANDEPSEGVGDHADGQADGSSSIEQIDSAEDMGPPADLPPGSPSSNLTSTPTAGCSPQRPKGSAEASLKVQNSPQQSGWFHPSVQSASKSLFRLFRSPSSTSIATMPVLASDSSRASITDPMFGELERNGQTGNLLSPKDAKALSKSVDKVAEAAERYQEAIKAMAAASADLGTALEELSKNKGLEKASSGISAAGGLQLLVSNHAQLLAASVEEKFVEPSKRGLSNYKEDLKDREMSFQSELKHRTLTLRRAESLTQRQSRARHRNLATYRSTLLDLTSQIDDINRLKYEFLSDLYMSANDLGEQLERQVASMVTAEIEIYDSIARKGWSGNGLDHLIAGCPDPFEATDKDRDEHSEAIDVAVTTSPETGGPTRQAGSTSPPTNLFSVLPNTSILPKHEDEFPAFNDHDYDLHNPDRLPVNGGA